MKRIFFLLSICCILGTLQAQQDHQYTQFMYNKLFLNPAYAGARGVPNVTAIYRNQWIGFDGAPQSALISVNTPFITPRVGMGVTVSTEQIGLQRDFYGALVYSYDLLAKDEISLRMGIQGSFRNVGFDFSEADPNDVFDNSLNDMRTTETSGNVGAGLYATFVDQFYLGFSAPHIYSNVIGINPDPNVVTAEEALHLYGMAGAILPIGEDINLMPAVLTKYVKNAPFDVELNVNLDIKETITAGVSYRLGGNGPGESLSLLAYWQIAPQFGLGASYDFPLTDVKDFSAGSIEALVSVDLKKTKKKMSNPRFFL